MVLNRPPMGWNSWNTFGGAINEQLLMETADKIVELGLDKCGYNYVVIDDCWSERTRDENARLVPDHNKFPHGMKYLADYIHSKGLKFGIYSDSGYYTCAGLPGSFDHEFIDAETFAEWGVDYLKYDNCYAPMYIISWERYMRMGLALRNCGRDIVYGACTAGKEDTRMWIKETGASLWRSTDDIYDSFESLKIIIKQEIQSLPYNCRGCYNDLDMLIVGMNGEGNVGMGGCTYEEYRLHFAFWCLFGSPLFIGADLRKLSDEYLDLLKHEELLKIDQDRAGNTPFLLGERFKYEPGNSQPFVDYSSSVVKLARILEDGKIALGVFNLTDSTVYDNYFVTDPYELGFVAGKGKHLVYKDLFTGDTKEIADKTFAVSALKPHDCRVFTVELVDD